MSMCKTNLSTPDLVHLPRTPNIGSLFILYGKIDSSVQGFYIALQNGADEDCDTPLRIDIQMDEKRVILCNKFEKEWQHVHVEGTRYDSLFQPGGIISIEITLAPDAYYVMLNGGMQVQYVHRLSFHDIKYMRLSEGVVYDHFLVQDPCRVPYRGAFFGNMKRGDAVRVRGCIDTLSDSPIFSVCFNCSVNEVAFRFRPMVRERHALLDCTIGGNWRDGERAYGNQSFPFKNGHYFDLLFVATFSQRFLVFVNGSYFSQFFLPVAVDTISNLTIEGEVNLMDVEFMDPLPFYFLKKIPSGLNKVDVISIRGCFLEEEDFTINLLKDTNQDSDKALHINTRRREDLIVFNSTEGGNWGMEARYRLPTEYQSFDMDIFSPGKDYLVNFNDKRFAAYGSNYKFEDIKAIQTKGFVSIYQIKLQYEVTCPYVKKLGWNMRPGSWVVVKGTAKENCKEFCINLQSGDSSEYGKGQIIPFHLNVQFESQKVQTFHYDGSFWGVFGSMELPFPFTTQDMFEVIIFSTEQRFKVYMNGELLADVSHMISQDRADHILLTGDCQFLEPEMFQASGMAPLMF